MPSGVYTITCTSTGKVYVGSSTGPLEKRWRKHAQLLRAGKHHSRKLQNAWKKYGEPKFVFEPLEHCAPEYCLGREQYWLNELRAVDSNYGYNMISVAGSTYGMRHTPEVRHAISQSMRKHERTEEHTLNLAKAHPSKKNKQAWKTRIRDARASHQLQACHPDTGELRLFPSYRSAMKSGFQYNCIKTSIIQERPYKGYIWEIIANTVDTTT